MTGANTSFEKVLGGGRGINDIRVLREQLADRERELMAAHGKLGGLQSERDRLTDDVRTLVERVEDLEEDLSISAAALTARERDRDFARYAAVRSGCRDPMLTVVPDEHHGIWSPGRPFLTGQHAIDPRTRACYRMREGGAQAGERPSKSGRWQRCRGDDCPVPTPMSTTRHPASSGFALRQSEHWWDASHKRWRLRDLTNEHLLGVIEWLRDAASGQWHRELSCGAQRVPCPPLAYGSSRTWLNDTPLMRALLNERRRRGIRPDPDRRQAWRWADEHPF